jgi:hypothetical protein
MKTVLAIAVLTVSIGLYQASTWWERALARKVSSEASPDGCLRLDAYDAFWVLPSVLHRIPSPELDGRYDLGMRWEAAIFVRAYEVSTGDYLGETIVFDPTAGNDFMDWGDPKKPGRRVVTVSGFDLVDSNRCSDPATLAKLGIAVEREREAVRAQRAIWDAEDRLAKPRTDSNR